jgi:hypothetical protein
MKKEAGQLAEVTIFGSLTIARSKSVAPHSLSLKIRCGQTTH